jgi:conjugal transfer pilus assembly protein TraV
MLTKRISILIFCLLTGCAGMNNKFDCPAKPGVTCKSVSEVNDMVDQGVLPRKDCPNGKCSSSQRPYGGMVTAEPFNAERYPEQLLTIWMAPFEDETGVRHSDSFMNVVVREAQWAQIK